MNRRVRLLAAEDEARHLCRPAVALREELIDAGAGLDVAARGERGAGEEIAGLRAVDVSLEGFGVVKALDEEEAFAVVGDGSQHLAEFHLGTFAAGPPLAAVEAVAGEKHCQSQWRFARRLAAGRFVAPNVDRLQPRERHRNAEAAEHRAA